MLDIFACGVKKDLVDTRCTCSWSIAFRIPFEVEHDLEEYRVLNTVRFVWTAAMQHMHGMPQ